jgi:hypothetical protein
LTLAEARERTSGGFTVRIGNPRRKKLYLKPLQPQFWESAKADFPASTAVAKYGWGVMIAREILVRRKDVERLWPFPAQRDTTAQASGGKRGRKPKWDLKRALLEMARLAPSPDKRPVRQSDMQRMIAEWFVREAGEHPSDSQIAEHVKDFYDRDWTAN